MLLDTESARSTAYFAAWAADADPDRLAEAAALAGRSVVDPWGDLLAPAAYRAAVAAPVARRALTSALQDAVATNREAA
jgi:hypothetical protein